MCFYSYICLSRQLILSHISIRITCPVLPPERVRERAQKPLAAVTYREEGSNGLAHDYRYFRTGASLRNYS